MAKYQFKLKVRNLFIRVMDRLGMKQTRIAELVGVSQGRVSTILKK